MKDSDLMPWGLHKGKTMEEVPAKYLMWLKEKIKPIAPNKRNYIEAQLLKYIEENQDAIDKELKEGKH